MAQLMDTLHDFIRSFLFLLLCYCYGCFDFTNVELNSKGDGIR